MKFPANTVIAPHTHSKPETLTILSGSVFHEHGEKVDKAAGKELRTGGFVYLPQDMPHSLWTMGEPVELQVNGSGPFGLNYINPADDPSIPGLANSRIEPWPARFTVSTVPVARMTTS